MGNVALRTAGLTKRYGRGIALAAGAAGLISLRRRDLGDLGQPACPAWPARSATGWRTTSSRPRKPR